MAKKKKIPDKLKIWIEARKRFRLSHEQIQMARELGMNPKGFGKPQIISKNPGRHLCRILLNRYITRDFVNSIRIKLNPLNKLLRIVT